MSIKAQQIYVMNLIQNGAAGYISTMGGMIINTLSLNFTYRKYCGYSCIVIFFS